MKYQSNLNLQRFNTLGISAIAKNAYIIDSFDKLLSLSESVDLSSAIILGGGSNVIIQPQTIERPLLINQTKGIHFIGSPQNKTVKVASGENWDKFVDWCIDNDCYGLENLALIPGTVGAAPIQNIGAYGVEVQSFIKSIEFYDFSAHKIIDFSHDECLFEYRDSIFKGSLKDKGFIVSVTFDFNRSYQPRIDYPGLEDCIAQINNETSDGNGVITPKMIAQAIRQLRQTKLPDPNQVHNVGSFFKNPILSNEAFEKLSQQYPTAPSFAMADGSSIKTSAAWLIEQSGYKGHQQQSGAGVSVKHALVLTNNGRASGQDILDLANEIQTAVFKKFAIELSIEPIIINEN